MKKSLSIAILFAMLLLPIIGMSQGDTTTYSKPIRYGTIKPLPTTLTIQGIKDCIAFDGTLGVSLRGIVDATYNKAKKAGKTEQEALDDAMAALGRSLDLLSSSTGEFGRTMPVSHISDSQEFSSIFFSCCDETPRSADSIEALGFIFVDTCCSTIWQRWPDGRFSCCPTKKDTILVNVACRRQLSETIQNHSSGSTLHLSVFNVLELKTFRQERTIEWQTVPLPTPSHNGLSFDIYRTETKWVVIKTGWLDPAEECYQLISIEH